MKSSINKISISILTIMFVVSIFIVNTFAGEKVVSVTTISLDEEVDAATSISENLEKDEE